MISFFAFICLLIVVMVTAEIFFRKRSVKKFGKVFEPVGKATLSDYVQKYRPYPYLPYLMQPAQIGENEFPAAHRFAKSGAVTRAFAINNNGLYDVLHPVQVSIASGKRIVLLVGSSAMEGIVYENEQFFSIGSLLQKELDNSNPGEYAVVTMAMAGWLSSEILIYAQLKYFRLKPSVVIYYHGANDVLAACAPNFSEDYSHYRRNISEVFPVIKRKLFLSSFFPYLPKFTFYEFSLRKLGLRFHPVYELSKLLRPNQPSANYSDKLSSRLEVEKENIRYILSAAKTIGAQVIAMPYQYWVYDKNAVWLNIQKKGVEIENQNLTDLCKELEVQYLSPEGFIELNDQFLLDEQHFSLRGMSEISILLAKTIRESK